MRSVRFALLAVVALMLAGGPIACGREAGELPRRMPDVEGETLENALGELRAQGFEEILLFTTDQHAVDPWDGLIPTDSVVLMTDPKPRDDTRPDVNLWLGDRPEVPANVPQDAWYYPHGDRIGDRGTDPCLVCHERPSCGTCHEERLDQTDALLSADPSEAPDLAAAIAAATGGGDVVASDHGSGWYQVEIAGSGEPREVALAAREAAVRAIPAGFEAASEAQTLVLRWVSGAGETLIEIGFVRATYEAEDWESVEPADIPWIADRYAVPSS